MMVDRAFCLVANGRAIVDLQDEKSGWQRRASSGSNSAETSEREGSLDATQQRGSEADMSLDGMTLSPELLARIKAEAAATEEPTWTPPAHSGLSNSTPLVDSTTDESGSVKLVAKDEVEGYHWWQKATPQDRAETMQAQKAMGPRNRTMVSPKLAKGQRLTEVISKRTSDQTTEFRSFLNTHPQPEPLKPAPRPSSFIAPTHLQGVDGLVVGNVSPGYQPSSKSTSASTTPRGGDGSGNSSPRQGPFEPQRPSEPRCSCVVESPTENMPTQHYEPCKPYDTGGEEVGEPASSPTLFTKMEPGIEDGVAYRPDRVNTGGRLRALTSEKNTNVSLPMVKKSPRDSDTTACDLFSLSPTPTPASTLEDPKRTRCSIPPPSNHAEGVGGLPALAGCDMSACASVPSLSSSRELRLPAAKTPPKKKKFYFF